jgi:two-component system, OmpR family, sensor histidine kinase KdpD
VVSRLSTQVQDQARLARQDRNRMRSLYELASRILLFDRHDTPGPQIAMAICETLQAQGLALLDGETGAIHTVGAPRVALDRLVLDAWTKKEDRDDSLGHHWSRVLRLGGRGTGAVTIEAQQLNPLMMDGIASIAAIAFERSRSLEKEALAEAARRSEQLRSTVLDALAHAFKTPLTAIMASSSGLLDCGDLHGADLELVRLIDNEAVHLNDLATRLLQTARLDSTALRLQTGGCSLGLLIEKVLSPFSGGLQGHPVEISLAAAAGEPSEATVSGDCELLATALRQLVDNAIKYSDPGTPVRIVARAGDDDLTVSVHNTGKAIPAEDRERIFERFYRSPGTEHRAAGTGLGLSITRKIAEAHGGVVRVASDDCAGTTFTLTVPLIRK